LSSPSRRFWKNIATTPEAIAFERGVRPVLEQILPEKADAILNFQPDPSLQRRIGELAEKSNEGELTADEQSEYEGYVRANNFIAILRSQARKLMQSPP
jgi:hypothetical protein